MPVWLCKECVGRDKGERKVQKEEESSFPTHTGLGVTLGSLSGNPVLIAVGAAAGALVDGKDKIADDLGFEAECELCGQKDRLESCQQCGRRVCSFCRYLLADKDEEAGSYKPYRESGESFDRGGWESLTPIRRGMDEGKVEEVLDLGSGSESSEGNGGEGGWGWGDAEYSTSEGFEGDYSFGEGEGAGESGANGEAGESGGSGEGSLGTGGDGDG